MTNCIVTLFLVLALSVVACFARVPPSPEDNSYKKTELPKLGKPDIEDASRERWQKLVDIAAKTEDPEIAAALLKVGKQKLDGYFSQNFDIHMTRFLKANPPFFLKSAQQQYGKQTVSFVIDRFVNESGEMSSAELGRILNTISSKDPVYPLSQRVIGEAKSRDSELIKQSEKEKKQ